ncbi:MAG: hypothetical protein ACYDCL_20720 [Myxococcales bacterium]
MPGELLVGEVRGVRGFDNQLPSLQGHDVTPALGARRADGAEARQDAGPAVTGQDATNSDGGASPSRPGAVLAGSDALTRNIERRLPDESVRRLDADARHEDAGVLIRTIGARSDRRGTTTLSDDARIDGESATRSHRGAAIDDGGASLAELDDRHKLDDATLVD